MGDFLGSPIAVAASESRTQKSGDFATKMDGENNGKPYEQMDDLGGNTPIFGNTHNISPKFSSDPTIWYQLPCWFDCPTCLIMSPGKPGFRTPILSILTRKSQVVCVYQKIQWQVVLWDLSWSYFGMRTYCDFQRSGQKKAVWNLWIVGSKSFWVP